MKKMSQEITIYSYGDEEIREIILRFGPSQIEKFAEKMTPAQVQLAFLTLIDPSQTGWSEKLNSLFNGIKEIRLLEAIGRSINLNQLLEILDFAARDKNQAWKLFPIFVTIPHPLFSQMLFEMPETRKKQLQNLCSSEPIQHHLLLYIHELKSIYEDYQNEYLQKLNEIRQLEGFDLMPEELNAMQSALGEFREKVNMTICKIENALSLAWSASSGDLIEMLSEERERFERFLFNIIGHPHHQLTSASGIYRLFEEQLAMVFCKNGEEYETLKDSEPAIEALTRLNLWYMEDYWRMGLLPQESDPAKLALPLLSSEPGLLEKYRHLVEQNLRQIGLKTVKDFKRHHLVSKPILANYIAKHQHKIK